MAQTKKDLNKLKRKLGVQLAKRQTLNVRKKVKTLRSQVSRLEFHGFL